MRTLAVPLAILALPVQVALAGHGRSQELKAAKALAEAETGGVAVDARRVFLNGTHIRDGLPGGIQVRVHMPGRKDGWSCLIDADTMKLRRKEPIPNPPKRSGRGG